MVKQTLDHGQINFRRTSKFTSTPHLTPAQEALQDLWETHLQSEFVAHNPEDALAMMVEDTYVDAPRYCSNGETG